MVLEIAESLRQADTIEDAKVAVQAIGKMVIAARGKDQEAFIDAAKFAAGCMSKLIEVPSVFSTLVERHFYSAGNLPHSHGGASCR